MSFATPSAGAKSCASALALSLIVVLASCERAPEARTRGPARQTDAQGGLFEAATGNLDRLEQFETEQILDQICDRLNQWYQQEKPQIEWRRDPLVETLSEELRKGPDVDGLDRMRFEKPDDAWFLQQAIWLRDVSTQARADQFQDLAVAELLFDWTVRNIQLESDAPRGEPATRHWPYETLLLGRGTAVDRAWLFLLLARQQGLDVVMLAVGDKPGQTPRLWLPALVLGGELYLFDSRLGMPIPGREEGSVATLSEVAADPQLLARLDLDDEHPYPVKAEDLQHVVAFVEGSPAALSKRMALVESRLAGQRKTKLTSAAGDVAARVGKIGSVAEARLWPLPFEVARDRAHLSDQERSAAAREILLFQAVPLLRRARALHFRGQYEGNEGAKRYYLNARPSDKQIDSYKLPDDVVKNLPPASVGRVEAAQILLLREAKHSASFWLGLIFFDQEDFPNAIDYLEKRTVGAATKSPWTAAARYNLARAYEAAGKPDEAIKLYESDTDSPQSHGNRLRARGLKEKAAK